MGGTGYNDKVTPSFVKALIGRGLNEVADRTVRWVEETTLSLRIASYTLAMGIPILVFWYGAPYQNGAPKNS